MRFGVGMNTDYTLEEVGLPFSVTRERIRQIKAKALRKLEYSIQKVLKTFVVIFLGTMALTVSAKLIIPFYPVPMTMQTFIVLFLGLAFGYKVGLATVGVYLLGGIIGIPVFSNSPEKA